MTNEEYKLTDEEWREFQSIPEQWFSHRAWVDARIAERVVDERAKTQEMKDYGDRAVHFVKSSEAHRADERAKRPDREQIDRIQFEIDNVHQIHGDTCLCGFKSSRSRSRTEHLTALFAEAVLALEPETDQELQDRIEVLEKNLAYEVAQKNKLAEQLQAATATDLTLEQARWKMHAGIESRCSEEVAAEVKPVIDLVFSSLALEPETREGKLERLAAVTNINSITKAMLEEVGYPSHFHPADAPSWAYSVLEEEHEARTAPEACEVTAERAKPHHALEVDVLTWHCLKCGRPARGHDKAREVTDAKAYEVTEAEVEAAARKIFEYDAPSHEPDEWSGLSEPLKSDYRGTARAALEAARKVK